MLITESYRAAQRQLHEENERYGAASKKFADEIRIAIRAWKPKSILDYGAGKRALRVEVANMVPVFEEYDPGVPEIENVPDGVFDMVCCIDVLEHIEPECLDDVLRSIREKTGVIAYMTIHTGPAGKYLPDGRNAHLIQRPRKWWRAQLWNHYRSFTARSVSRTTFLVACKP